MRGDLKELILKSKNGDEVAKCSLLEKYEPLIKKVVFSYYVKGYENEDLFQISTMWFLVAIDKYNLDTNSDFSSYVMRTIHNNMKCLIRKIAKENYDKSIYDKDKSGVEFVFTLSDYNNIEENYEEKETKMKLKKILSLLKEEDKEFIDFLFSDKKGNLSKWSREKGVAYGVARKRKEKLMLFLKNQLS